MRHGIVWQRRSKLAPQASTNKKPGQVVPWQKHVLRLQRMYRKPPAPSLPETQKTEIAMSGAGPPQNFPKMSEPSRVAQKRRATLQTNLCWRVAGTY